MWEISQLFTLHHMFWVLTTIPIVQLTELPNTPLMVDSKMSQWGYWIMIWRVKQRSLLLRIPYLYIQSRFIVANKKAIYLQKGKIIFTVCPIPPSCLYQFSVLLNNIFSP